MRRTVWLAVALLLVAAASVWLRLRDEEPPVVLPPEQAVLGSWRAVLASPGGELPFRLVIAPDRHVGLRAFAVSADERLPFSSVEVTGNRVLLSMAWYDAVIDARWTAGRNRMSGEWRRTAAGGAISRLPFDAYRADRRRFLPLAAVGIAPGAAHAVPSVAGSWAATFRDEKGVTSPAVGEWRQQGEQVTGTFLTPTGDHRFLEGSYERGVLRLSAFDGSHAYLFQARAQDDGSLTGDFWSRDVSHETWTARRAAPGEATLPDGWSAVGLTNQEGRLAFRFDDLSGRPVSLADPRFQGKVVVVNLFGSWCPNCNDEAPLLAAWHRRYGPRGLELVGLAFEYTGDTERDRRQLRRYAERHGIRYPLLLAGTSKKTDAAAALPDLTRVAAFPTTVFVGRDGRVRKIYSGFSGPGTGDHFQALAAELEGTLESLLAEPTPGA